MIAILPTYQAIGTAAPVLLLVARMAQGLSVGGEYGTAATYMSEVAGKGRRGFYSSFQYVTLVGGQLFALLVVVILQQTLAPDELKQWGWRIPFFIGALAAVVAMYLRRSLPETASAETMHHKEAGSLSGLWHHKRALLLVLAFTMGGSLYFYTFTTYMQKFLVNSVKIDVKLVSMIMTAALIIFMLLQPVFGALSDRIGRRNNMILFSGCATLAVVPLMTALSNATDSYAVFGLIMLGLVIACFYTSISGVVKAELFPPEVRALGVGLPYAIANALFGGTAEFVALWLKSAGYESLFFWYVSAMALVALIASIRMPDPRTNGYLEGSGKI
jgi:MHS family alpha-ketoglutarate permease-like MFS transporter